MAIDDIHEYIPSLTFLSDYITQDMIFTIGVPIFFFVVGIFIAVKYHKIRF